LKDESALIILKMSIDSHYPESEVVMSTPPDVLALLARIVHRWEHRNGVAMTAQGWS